MKYRVTGPHEPGGAEALVISEGGKLRYERRPTEWSGWIWCLTAHGKGAWVPESWVEFRGEFCVFLQDYDSRELSVRKGETLEVELEESGWAWARNSAGECGWVPADRLEPAPHFAKSDRYKLDSYNTYNYKWARSYDSIIWLKVFRVSHWDELIVNELTPGIEALDILDVGCATGRLLTALGEAGAENLSGVDLAPRILETARQKLASRGLSGELRPADVEELIPWPDGTFDVATLTGVFHHLMRPRDALCEIARVLRKSGRLVIVDARFSFPLRQIFNLYLRVWPSEGDYRFYSSSSIMRMLAALGWRSVKTRGAGWSGYMITAERPDTRLGHPSLFHHQTSIVRSSDTLPLNGV